MYDGLLNWIIKHDALWTAIVSAVSVIIAAAFRFGYDRFISERAASRERLLERYARNRLGTYGRARLQKEAREALADWQKELVPPLLGDKLAVWPESEFTIVAKDVHESPSASHCPRVNDRNSRERPLFFTTTPPSDDASQVALTQAVIRSVSDQLARVAENHPGSSDLIKYRSDEERSPIRIWVSLPHLRISTTEQVLTLMEALARLLRKWIPELALACEFYISDDLQKEFSSSVKSAAIAFVPRQVGDSVNSALNSPLEATYAIARSAAVAVFQHGAIFDVADLASPYPISDDILRKRFDESFPAQSLDPSTWKCIAISGPPGSGKTDLVRMLASDLVNKYGLLVVALRAESSLSAFEYITTGRNRDDAHDALHRCLRRLIPHEHVDSPMWQDGFTDAFLALAANEAQRLTVLLDDLLPRANLKALLSKLLQSDSGKTPHLVLIGRPKLDFLPEDGTIHIECSHWKRGEAASLLRSWVEDGFRGQAAKALKSGWAEKRKEFSTYHLRVLVQFVDRPDVPPSAFMREELQRMAAPIGKHLVQLHRPAEYVLQDIRQLLEEGKPSGEILDAIDNHVEVDVVKVLGLISWMSKYEATWESGATAGLQVLMSPSRLREWCSNYLRSLMEAETFISVVAHAGVFRNIRGGAGAEWVDNFIADGFAASYFGSNMLQSDTTIADETIAEMVEKLQERNSLDILPFALRSDQLVRLVRAVVVKKPHLVHTINGIMSDATVGAWLSKEPVLADDLTNDLLRMAEIVETSRLGPLGVAFASLVEFNEKASMLESQRLGHNDAPGRLSAASLAARSKSLSSYFELADASGVDKMLSTEISLWFAKQQNSSDFVTRICGLLASGRSFQEIEELWQNWCISRSLEQLYTQLFAILEDRQCPSHDAACLVEKTCEEMSERRRGRDVVRRSDFVAAILHLHGHGRLDVAEKVVGWMAHFSNSQICRRREKWVLDKTGTVAIQENAQQGMRIAQILEQFRGTSGLSLPSSRELERISGADYEGKELVSDGFPQGYSYSRELRPDWLKCWNGKALQQVERQEIENSSFRWRVSMRVE